MLSASHSTRRTRYHIETYKRFTVKASKGLGRGLNMQGFKLCGLELCLSSKHKCQNYYRKLNSPTNDHDPKPKVKDDDKKDRDTSPSKCWTEKLCGDEGH